MLDLQLFDIGHQLCLIAQLLAAFHHTVCRIRQGTAQVIGDFHVIASTFMI